MTGFQGANTAEGGDQFAQLVMTSDIGSALASILMAEAIIPGSSPSYELCKLIYAFHPIGAKLAETPINMAQSQKREITIPVSGEERLVDAFDREWQNLAADTHIKNLKIQSRIYGISSLVMGDRNKPKGVSEPVKWEELAEAKPFFTVLDPLNTAGSLILNQDPNSPDFQKPTQVRSGQLVYHPSRTLVVMNEDPLYIQWSDSAYGFSGRSIYQRALFPLKTFLQSMITDDMVTKKVGLLIYKAKSPGPIQGNRALAFFGFKRSALKGGMTGNVANIGIEESIESVNLQNLEGPASFARSNALKNIAMSAGMPAKLLEQEELVEGLAEGTEDAKQIARHIDRLRIEMTPIYAFFDRVVQRRAWSKDFFKTMQKDYSEYKRLEYNTVFMEWSNKFTANWPNLLAEPESKQIEVEKTRFESAVAVAEVAAPLIRTEENRAALLAWLADEVNSRRKLFSAPLLIDEKAEAEYEPPMPEGAEGAEGQQPGSGQSAAKQPQAFSSRT